MAENPKQNSIFRIRSLFIDMFNNMLKSENRKLTIVLLSDETIIGSLIEINVNHPTNTYTVNIKTDTGEKIINFKDVDSTSFDGVTPIAQDKAIDS